MRNQTLLRRILVVLHSGGGSDDMHDNVDSHKLSLQEVTYIPLLYRTVMMHLAE